MTPLCPRNPPYTSAQNFAFKFLMRISLFANINKNSERYRTQAEKVGRLEYIIGRIKRLEKKIDQIDLKMNVLTAGLSDWISFKPSCVQKVACQDEVDLEIVTRLYQAGEEFGVLKIDFVLLLRYLLFE